MENTTTAISDFNKAIIYNKFEDGSDVLTEKKKNKGKEKISWYFSWYSSDNNIVSKGETIKACDIQSAIIEWGKTNSGTIIYIQNKSL